MGFDIDQTYIIRSNWILLQWKRNEEQWRHIYIYMWASSRNEVILSSGTKLSSYPGMAGCRWVGLKSITENTQVLRGEISGRASMARQPRSANPVMHTQHWNARHRRQKPERRVRAEARECGMVQLFLFNFLAERTPPCASLSYWRLLVIAIPKYFITRQLSLFSERIRVVKQCQGSNLSRVATQWCGGCDCCGSPTVPARLFDLLTFQHKLWF